MSKPVLKLFCLLLFALVLGGCGGGRQGVLSYEILVDEVWITDCDEAAEGDLEIPTEIEGLPVTDIRQKAFDSCSRLTSVTIPEGVFSIGWAAFYGCNSLTSITVASDNASHKSVDGVVLSKDGSQFMICPTGKSGNYTIPESVTSVEKSSFYGCSNLASITIPESVTSIADSAFMRCNGLTSFKVAAGNSSYKSVGDVIFSKDGSLIISFPAGKSGEYRIPDSVTTISGMAFLRCRSLTSITIPDSVTTISNGAFGECSSLISIIIPASVTSIERAAFAGCRSLPSITIPESVTSIDDDAFGDCVGLTSISLPKAFHSETEASRLGLDKLWPDGFFLPDSTSK